MPNFVPVVYSNGGPVLASNGGQRVACAHLAQWLKVYDALQVARGRGHVVYYQTMGGADASAGTHNCGSAWDMQYTGTAPIMDAREMGAADWPRLHSNGWVGGEHVHGLIRCGDNGCNGYQYTAWLSGHNGLGLNGVGAGDPLPKPSTIRTWQDGIAWAQAEIARLTSPMTITQEDDDMRDIIAAAYRTYLGREGGTAELDGWTLSTVKQGKTAAQILPQISDSAEGRAYATTSSYKTYLGRAPSAGDIAFWSKQGGFDAIVAGISSSTEAKNRKV